MSADCGFARWRASWHHACTPQVQTNVSTARWWTGWGAVVVSGLKTCRQAWVRGFFLCVSVCEWVCVCVSLAVRSRQTALLTWPHWPRQLAGGRVQCAGTSKTPQINHLTSLWRSFCGGGWGGDWNLSRSVHMWICNVTQKVEPVRKCFQNYYFSAQKKKKKLDRELWINKVVWLYFPEGLNAPQLRPKKKKTTWQDLACVLSTVFTHSYHTHLHCQLRSKCAGRTRDKGLVQLWSSAHKPLFFSSFHPPLDSAILQKCSVSLSQRQTPGAAAAARSVPDSDTVTTPPPSL